jgi:hypothetical protein
MEIKSYLGRYEAETKGGMMAYLEVAFTEGGTYKYSYGIGRFPPKEVVHISTEAELIEKVENALECGYRKVQNIEEVVEARELEQKTANFDFLGWMAGGK